MVLDTSDTNSHFYHNTSKNKVHNKKINDFKRMECGAYDATILFSWQFKAKQSLSKPSRGAMWVDRNAEQWLTKDIDILSSLNVFVTCFIYEM